jgi:hypothetical protein
MYKTHSTSNQWLPIIQTGWKFGKIHEWCLAVIKNWSVCQFCARELHAFHLLHMWNVLKWGLILVVSWTQHMWCSWLSSRAGWPVEREKRDYLLLARRSDCSLPQSAHFSFQRRKELEGGIHLKTPVQTFMRVIYPMTRTSAIQTRCRVENLL